MADHPTAKNIMIQGTMSSAGKSLVCTALCRILRQDGYRVAPFKSQNMALNSFITTDGGEIGRAQAVQAEAAGIPPDTRMNPILLKPVTDMGSQVIVNGRAVGSLSASEYFRRKKSLIPHVLDAYQSLAAEYDVIVIEGAGSPAEINLKSDDLVNMGLAAMVDAPVFLVGDIDRGGVFAQLYGTMALLEPAERSRVRGILINKFRGDLSLLEPGLRQLEDLCGVPVAGVIPWLDVHIDEEDSLTGRFQRNPVPGQLDLAVIRLPRISNFTDFTPFTQYGSVSLRYVERVEDLGDPDLIFLPGTKSTVADLLWMRQNGLEAAILQRTAAGTPVFGICGGFQMLGHTIADPEHMESAAVTEVRGMGLLHMETVFRREKTQARVHGVFRGLRGLYQTLNGLPYEGYEIHMGQCIPLPDPDQSGHNTRQTGLNTDRAKPDTDQSAHRPDQTGPDPAVVQSGSVCGTYIHGLFDAPGVSDALIQALCQRKGLDCRTLLSPQDPRAPGSLGMSAFRQTQYDRLASAVRRSLDLSLLYRVIDREEA